MGCYGVYFHDMNGTYVIPTYTYVIPLLIVHQRRMRLFKVHHDQSPPSASQSQPQAQHQSPA